MISCLVVEVDVQNRARLLQSGAPSERSLQEIFDSQTDLSHAPLAFLDNAVEKINCRSRKLRLELLESVMAKTELRIEAILKSIRHKTGITLAHLLLVVHPTLL